MKLKNTTDFPLWFLRRMTAWCCRQLGDLKLRDVASVTFRRSRGAYGGVARTHRRAITVCVGRPVEFPCESMTHRNGHSMKLADRVEALVWVIAHELAHVMQALQRTGTRQQGGHAGSEMATEWHAKPVVEAFRAQRAALLAAWEEPPAVALRPKPEPAQLRASKAEADLARWERKLKLAQTKVRKLRRRVLYYQTKMQPQ